MTDSTLQLTYLARPDEAYEGQPGDMNPKFKVTKRCETAAGIGFGLAVSYGTGDEDAVLGGTNQIGVTIRDWQSEEGKYEQNDEMSVMTQGPIYVKIASASSKGAVLKSIDATGVIDTGAPGAGETALPGRLETSTSAVNEIALITLGG